MELGSNNTSSLAPFVYDSENYQAWAIKIQAYMEGYDYWESIEDNYDVALLSDNPTMVLMKIYLLVGV